MVCFNPLAMTVCVCVYVSAPCVYLSAPCVYVSALEWQTIMRDVTPVG